MVDLMLEKRIAKKLQEYLATYRRAKEANGAVPISFAEEFERYFIQGADGLLFHGTARSFGFQNFYDVSLSYRGIKARKRFLHKLLEEPISTLSNIVNLATTPEAMFKYGAGSNPFLVVDDKRVKQIHKGQITKLDDFEWKLYPGPLDPRTVEIIHMSERDFDLVLSMYENDFETRTYCDTDKNLSEIICPIREINHPIFGKGYVWQAIKPYLLKGIRLTLSQQKG